MPLKDKFLKDLTNTCKYASQFFTASLLTFLLTFVTALMYVAIVRSITAHVMSHYVSVSTENILEELFSRIVEALPFFASFIAIMNFAQYYVLTRLMDTSIRGFSTSPDSIITDLSRPP